MNERPTSSTRPDGLVIGRARRGPAVLAVTADDDRYATTRLEGARLASEQAARLILYDWDAATVLGDPLPSVWSGDGAKEETPTELDETDLEAAGRAQIADQVTEARRSGVPATAWLPSEPGPDALVRYAREHGATTIVVPADLEASGELERLAAGTDDPAGAVEAESPVRVVVVARPEPDGR